MVEMKGVQCHSGGGEILTSPYVRVTLLKHLKEFLPLREEP